MDDESKEFIVNSGLESSGFLVPFCYQLLTHKESFRLVTVQFFIWNNQFRSLRAYDIAFKVLLIQNYFNNLGRVNRNAWSLFTYKNCNILTPHNLHSRDAAFDLQDYLLALADDHGLKLGIYCDDYSFWVLQINSVFHLYLFWFEVNVLVFIIGDIICLADQLSLFSFFDLNCRSFCLHFWVSNLYIWAVIFLFMPMMWHPFHQSIDSSYRFH